MANVDITNTHLSEYVTSDSTMFFQICLLGLSKEFFPLPVNKWKEDTRYRAGAAILKAFKVTNDRAERTVKLVEVSGTCQEEGSTNNKQYIMLSTIWFAQVI